MYTEENSCTHDGSGKNSAFQQGTERNNSYSFLKPLHKQNTNNVHYSDHVNTSGIYSFDFLNDIIILNLLTCLLASFYGRGTQLSKVTSFSSLSSLMTTKYTGWDSSPYFQPSITTVYTAQSFSPYTIFTWSSICIVYIYIYIHTVFWWSCTRPGNVSNKSSYPWRQQCTCQVILSLSLSL